MPGRAVTLVATRGIDLVSIRSSAAAGYICELKCPRVLKR